MKRFYRFSSVRITRLRIHGNGICRSSGIVLTSLFSSGRTGICHQ